MSELLRAALGYAQRGWHVFPVHDKTPRTTRGHLDASVEIDVIESMLTTTKATGIGVACGVSGLCVVDLDGEQAITDWTSLAGHHGGHTPTLVAETAAGLHIYFQTRDPRALSTTGRLAPHVDTRGRGGYVVAPPSRHPTGARYRWRDPDAPLAAVSRWLLRLLERPTFRQR